MACRSRHLVKLSHIHLFGIGLVTFVLGFVFCFSTLPAWFKNVVIVAPFFAMVIDIATWYLTKWDPVFAYTVIVSGLILGSAWGIQIFVSLYQIIFLPAAEKKAVAGQTDLLDADGCACRRPMKR